MVKKNESKMGTSQATFYVKKRRETSESKNKEKEGAETTVQDPSLSRMLKCRKNLKSYHKRVTDAYLKKKKKRVTDEKQKGVLIDDSLSNAQVQFRSQRDLFCMQPQGQTSLSGNNEAEVDLVCVGGQIMTTSQLIRVLDPWISPYSPSDRKKMLEVASTQVKESWISKSFRGKSRNYLSSSSSSSNHAMYRTAIAQTLSNSPLNYSIQDQPLFQNQLPYWSSPPEMGTPWAPLLGIPVQHYTQMTAPDLDPNFYASQNLNWVPTEAEGFQNLENNQPSFDTAVAANNFYDASDAYPSNFITEFAFPDDFLTEDQDDNMALSFTIIYDTDEVSLNLNPNESISINDIINLFSGGANEISALESESILYGDHKDWDGLHLAESLNSNFFFNS